MASGVLTTHVLDTAHGRPAAGMKVWLYRQGENGCLTLLSQQLTNSDGRLNAPLLGGDSMQLGQYQLQFAVGDYFRAQGVVLDEPAFLEQVPLAFGISSVEQHYHVPLLVSPYSFSSYRGS